MESSLPNNHSELLATATDCFSSLACIAAGILGSRDLAEDMVQQAVSIAIEKNIRFSTREGLIGWLAGTVKFCALNHRRKSQRNRTFATDPLQMSEFQQHSESTVPSPVDHQSGAIHAEQNAFDDRVLRALNCLSDEARCCLLLRVVEDLSYQEIARMLGMPQGTAMNHVHRAKQTLRGMLDDAPAPRSLKAGETT